MTINDHAVAAIDRDFILAHFDRALDDGVIARLPNHYRGKVRESFDLADGRRVMIATDRLSAFDRNLCAIPFKGQVLTTLARFWFDRTGDICPNHVIAHPDPNVVICRRLSMVPVEVVVRGYLAGTTNTSILKLYREGQRDMYGMRLPDGLAPHAQLPTPIITPTSKPIAGHDAPLTARDIVDSGLISADRWDEICDTALALFAYGQKVAARHGLILADTKYEFGIDEEGRLRIADEIHTPDSSRFWLANSYETLFESGLVPDSLDKDVIRGWVGARCDPYSQPIPAIPSSLIADAALAYIEAYQRLTGETFEPDLSGATTLERIDTNLRIAGI